MRKKYEKTPNALSSQIKCYQEFILQTADFDFWKYGKMFIVFEFRFGGYVTRSDVLPHIASYCPGMQ